MKRGLQKTYCTKGIKNDSFAVLIAFLLILNLISCDKFKPKKTYYDVMFCERSCIDGWIIYPTSSGYNSPEECQRKLNDVFSDTASTRKFDPDKYHFKCEQTFDK